MPFTRKGAKYRGNESIGPYGPGIGFAIGSGERLAARRRGIAQTKAFLRRYPDFLPEVMDTMNYGRYGHSEGEEHINSFAKMHNRSVLGQFGQTSWEDLTASFPHPSRRARLQTPCPFGSSPNPAFGTQRGFFWPSPWFAEGFQEGEGMHRPNGDKGVVEEHFYRRQLGDYLNGYGGLDKISFPPSFDSHRTGGFEPARSDHFDNNRYQGSGVTRDDDHSEKHWDNQPNCECLLDTWSAQAQSGRGSPRNSYERFRPEDP